MSWSYKIAIFFGSFVVMISAMVYVASKQTNEMQDENYYAKELKYQDVIDGKNNLNAISDKVTINDTTDVIKIKIPAQTATAITEGTIYFLRPSDETKDVHLKLEPNLNGEQIIAKTKFIKGLYTIQLSWKSQNKKYYLEKSIFIQ